LSAPPTSASDSPSEYTFAVSMKFTPPSSDVPMIPSTSFAPSLPIASQKPLPPKVIVPRHSSDT
jgi:hypothetical protein